MQILKFKPTYKKKDGLVVIGGVSVPLPENFKSRIQSTIVFPVGAVGGNHKHPRIEAFYSTGDLTLIHLDGSGRKKQVSMAPEGDNYKLFIISSNLPHAVVNQTDNEIIMIEFANEEQRGVETTELI